MNLPDPTKCSEVADSVARQSEGIAVIQRVGIHDFTFEACSTCTRVTACQVAHPLTWALSRGFDPAGYPPNRSPASESNRFYSGGSFPHW